MLRAGKQDLILIQVIDTPQGIDQFAGIPSDPDMRIFEMPRGDNDLHNVTLDGTMVGHPNVRLPPPRQRTGR